MFYLTLRPRAFPLVLFALFCFLALAVPAMAQDGTTDAVVGIMTAVGAVVAALATFVARWRKTNPSNPWYVRLTSVADLSQIFDSTRSLEDE